MAIASTTAWVVHDLGLAAGFGGTLFGKMALQPAADEIRSKTERRLVLDRAWSGFESVRILSLAAVTTTWLAGRTFLSGDFAGRDVRGLVVTKDILMGALVVSGIASSVSGALLGEEHKTMPESVGAGSDTAGAGAHASPRVRTLRNIVNVASVINVAAMAAVIGVTTVLAMKSGRSARWGLLANLLP